LLPHFQTDRQEFSLAAGAEKICKLVRRSIVPRTVLEFALLQTALHHARTSWGCRLRPSCARK
jgi:hypothetical protein